MRAIGQIACVFAVAFGVGLLVASGMVEIAPRAENNVDRRVAPLERSARAAEFYHNLTVGMKGAGAAFLTFGALGLVVPWANVLVYGRRGGSPSRTEPTNLASKGAP